VGVTSVAEYIRCNLESEFSDTYKEAHGFRPRGFAHMSNEELQEGINDAINWIRAEEAREAERVQMEEAAHKERKMRNRYVPNNAFAGLKDLLGG